MQGKQTPHTRLPMPVRVCRKQLHELAAGLSSQVRRPFRSPTPPTLVIKPWVNWVIQAVILCCTNWDLERNDQWDSEVRTLALRHSQNQDHVDCPMTLSQFFRPLPSHQMFPSIAGRPHSSSHRARVRRFSVIAHIECLVESIADSCSFIS